MVIYRKTLKEEVSYIIKYVVRPTYKPVLCGTTAENIKRDTETQLLPLKSHKKQFATVAGRHQVGKWALSCKEGERSTGSKFCIVASVGFPESMRERTRVLRGNRSSSIVVPRVTLPAHTGTRVGLTLG
jgi:hypothetical protein